ncbi:MAG: hypothetical protein MUP04_04820 [Anaerolineae bacterium]|nr:hypothetical protein [Anaerolineae bacterium]
MTPYFGDKFWDFVVSFLSVILGGGAIVAYIEWRRYQREQRALKREEEGVAIEVVSAEIEVAKWKVVEKMSPEEQLRIYKNHLEDMVKEYTIGLEFVARNTTNTEQLITGIETEEPGIPVREGIIWNAEQFDEYVVFDLQSLKYLGYNMQSTLRLDPYATLGRCVYTRRKFDEKRRLEKAPSAIVVKVKMSEGRSVVRSITLNEVPTLPWTVIEEDGTSRRVSWEEIPF